MVDSVGDVANSGLSRLLRNILKGVSEMKPSKENNLKCFEYILGHTKCVFSGRTRGITIKTMQSDLSCSYDDLSAILSVLIKADFISKRSCRVSGQGITWKFYATEKGISRYNELKKEMTK